MALISEPAGGRDFRERQSRGYQEPLRVLNASLRAGGELDAIIV